MKSKNIKSNINLMVPNKGYQAESQKVSELFDLINSSSVSSSSTKYFNPGTVDNYRSVSTKRNAVLSGLASQRLIPTTLYRKPKSSDSNLS